MKTIIGRLPAVGIGLTTNERRLDSPPLVVTAAAIGAIAPSPSPWPLRLLLLDEFLLVLPPPAPRDDLRRLDLKFSLAGSLTIHDGGTIML
jgi:hypothetical protein